MSYPTFKNIMHQNGIETIQYEYESALKIYNELIQYNEIACSFAEWLNDYISYSIMDGY